MEKFSPATTVFVVMLGLLVSSSPVAAQETNPAAVIKAVYDAVAAKDIDSAMALVADDMVLTLIPPPPGLDGTFIGKEEIRNWLEGLAQNNGRAEFSDITVSGNAATWKARWWADSWEALGVGPAEFEGINIARGGLLKAATWVFTEEFSARLETAIVMKTTKEEVLTTRVEDLIGIWKGWHAGNVVYRQFEADGSLKCSTKVEWLRDPSLLQYSGRFWFEEGVFKFTESLGEAHGYGPGSYEVRIRKKDGNAVHLSFHDMGDPASMRADDWGKGMMRVEQ
jgi:ketosteroid isomerase-like protein